jgi:hypothetical protein
MADDPVYRREFSRWERQAERRARPEYQERLERRRRFVRLREIWGAIVEDVARRSLPIRERIKATPRIRGCGAAAKKAGFAG